jgi:hypothetical protein
VPDCVPGSQTSCRTGRSADQCQFDPPRLARARAPDVACRCHRRVQLAEETIPIDAVKGAGGRDRHTPSHRAPKQRISHGDETVPLEDGLRERKPVQHGRHTMMRLDVPRRGAEVRGRRSVRRKLAAHHDGDQAHPAEYLGVSVRVHVMNGNDREVSRNADAPKQQGTPRRAHRQRAEDAGNEAAPVDRILHAGGGRREGGRLTDRLLDVLKQALFLDAVLAGEEADRFDGTVWPPATAQALRIQDRACLRMEPQKLRQHQRP